MRRSAYALSFLLCLSASFSPTVVAEIFHYTDGNGRKVYVDSPHKIPPQYREKSQTIATEQRTDEEKLASQASHQQISNEFQRKQQIRKLEQTIEKMTTPVKIIGNQVLVPVDVVWRGRKASLHLLLDTGASMTVLHRDGVSSLNIASRNSSYAQVAGGGIIKTERVVFDRVELGPYKIENKSTAVIETTGQQAFDGLLGMDILGGGQYKIDFQQRKIIWSPEKYQQFMDALEKLKAIKTDVDDEADKPKEGAL
ncbi:retropepsin-like aspartic protease [Amphritea sp. 2_MG-2023]|uniref:retropepsin-like aspartic protease n=1 Tax=Amphritea TaxID=515417 RepID=UPI001C06F44A|nr:MULTISPECIES: retropepsin-like aspartic protease [Amphritea]MBU2964310.1 retroviral-like aspartic protease family protein [Amphritea atlantica]MDO6419432.1 retropepsin-like aspartic protease [Amphritea sp. 2_MG-2023]